MLHQVILLQNLSLLVDEQEMPVSQQMVAVSCLMLEQNLVERQCRNDLMLPAASHHLRIYHLSHTTATTLKFKKFNNTFLQCLDPT